MKVVQYFNHHHHDQDLLISASTSLAKWSLGRVWVSDMQVSTLLQPNDNVDVDNDVFDHVDGDVDDDDGVDVNDVDVDNDVDDHHDRCQFLMIGQAQLVSPDDDVVGVNDVCDYNLYQGFHPG